MDVFEGGNATVGGAPFNVAFQAHQLLTASNRGRGDMVSAIGTDKWGRHILSALEDASISAEYVAVNPDHPTGVASVFVGAGEAGFEIAPDAAWDYLEGSASTDNLARESTAVAFGSLAQRSPRSGEMVRDFVGKVKGHRLYDVNLRRNTTDGICGYSVEIVDSSCRVATIMKCNEAELDELGTMLGFSAAAGNTEDRIAAQMARLRGMYGLFAVIVTRGAKGAMLMTEDVQTQLPDSMLGSQKINPVGAGDAFSAGLLYGLTQGWSIRSSGEIADRLASWVTGFESATPRLTPEIKSALDEIESRAAVDTTSQSVLKG